MKTKLLSIASALSLLIIAPTPAFALFNVNQGGTGAATFGFGQLLFGNGANPIQTASSLLYSTSTQTLIVQNIAGLQLSNFTIGAVAKIGTEADLITIQGATAASNGAGGDVLNLGGFGNGTGPGGRLDLSAGKGGNTGDGGQAELDGGESGENGGNGGLVFIQGGVARPGSGGNGGNIEILPGQARGTGSPGVVKVYSPLAGGTAGVLNFNLITTADKTFTFPNFSGTFGLLENNQAWTGTNTFNQGATGTTTVNFGQMGSSTSHACFNTKNTDGNDISFYFVGTSMVVENNVCL